MRGVCLTQTPGTDEAVLRPQVCDQCLSPEGAICVYGLSIDGVLSDAPTAKGIHSTPRLVRQLARQECSRRARLCHPQVLHRDRRCRVRNLSRPAHRFKLAQWDPLWKRLARVLR